MLEPCEGLSEGETLGLGHGVQELGGDGGGEKVQAGLGGVGGLEVLGDKPVAKEGAKLVAIEDSPTVFRLLGAGKPIRVGVVGKDVAGDSDFIG